MKRANVRRRGEDKLIERAADLDNNARILTEAGLISAIPIYRAARRSFERHSLCRRVTVTESQTIPAMGTWLSRFTDRRF